MKALITGITGQDGSYLAEFLLSRGYEVHGMVRPSSSERCERISHILHRVKIHQADLLDQLSVISLIEEVKPDEVYNLAAYTPPDGGWQAPMMAALVNGLGAARLLETVRLVTPAARLLQASTAEMFGHPERAPQNETTPFNPTSPQAAAKLYAHNLAVAYRQRHGLKVCCAILYDHESPRRSLEFTTRRISRAAARIKLGLDEKLTLETLDLTRDWGFAGDYVRAFWMMLQRPDADDYVIATGRTHTLEEFCRLAFAAVDLDWRNFVMVEKPFYRPDRVNPLVGDTTRARRRLLWEPEVPLEKLARMMVEADLEQCSRPGRLQVEASRPSEAIPHLKSRGVEIR